MITPGEYTLLLTDEVQRAIAANRGRDPLEVALDRNTPHARLVATQVKYLARAEAKLPSYAAAQCILPPLAFEQASSEACAAHKRIAGGAVLDLTCGLGADAFFLARRFRRVVTLERDQTLARIAAENFRRLGATNIEVVNTSAEAYLAQPGLHFDWVYADPDRFGRYVRKWYGSSVKILDNNTIDLPTLGERPNILAGIVCKVSDSETLRLGNTTGSAGRVLEFENPYMTMSLLRSLWHRIGGFSWYTTELFHRLGDPRFDVGDVITYVSESGESYDIPITNIGFNFDGGLSADISAVGLSVEEQL